MSRPPLPPFTAETAAQKARMAEDAWNSRDPARVALAYTADSRWRNRSEFLQGRAAIEAFLTRKWQRELDYRLIKEVWAFRENRIAVRFAYEWHDDSGHWFRSYGNENWEFAEDGLMAVRHASINDVVIDESERKYHWPPGPRPAQHPSLTELGFSRSRAKRGCAAIREMRSSQARDQASRASAPNTRSVLRPKASAPARRRRASRVSAVDHLAAVRAEGRDVHAVGDRRPPEGQIAQPRVPLVPDRKGAGEVGIVARVEAIEEPAHHLAGLLAPVVRRPRQHDQDVGAAGGDRVLDGERVDRSGVHAAQPLDRQTAAVEDRRRGRRPQGAEQLLAGPQRLRVEEVAGGGLEGRGSR